MEHECPEVHLSSIEAVTWLSIMTMAIFLDVPKVT
jgi:hypothetical protein